MIVYLALVLAGTLLSLLLTPLVRAASTRLGLVDAPGGRKVHPLPVPRLGGVAVVAAAAAALMLVVAGARMVGTPVPDFIVLWPILAGAGLVFAAGVVDDVSTLSAGRKLGVQTAASALVMASGLIIERLTLGGETLQLGWLAYPVTLAWIVGLTNAFNLIDGIDGLAAGIAVIAGGTCAAILVARGHAAEAMLLAALVGGTLGFLAYNFAPASIFLGDGGSLVFGFVLASTAITGWQKGATALAAGVPLLIFALPLADAAAALVRRAAAPPARGARSSSLLTRIAQPDRLHIHHRLLALGWTTRQIVVLLYAVTLVLSAIALATARFE